MIARYAAGDRYAGYHPAWRTFFAAADWIERNTPRTRSSPCEKPRLFHALADRRVRLYPYVSDADSVLQVVRQSDYVLVDAIFGTTQRFLVPGDPAAERPLPCRSPDQAPVTLVLGVTDDPPADRP